MRVHIQGINPTTTALVVFGIVLVILLQMSFAAKGIDESKKMGVNRSDYAAQAIEAAEPIQVGLNSRELKGIQASLFSDCDAKLSVGEFVWITNDEDESMPTVRVQISRIVQRGTSNSRGCMFLSHETTKKLSIFTKTPGIRTLSLRRQNPTPQNPKKMVTEAGSFINVQRDVNLIKVKN